MDRDCALLLHPGDADLVVDGALFAVDAPQGEADVHRLHGDLDLPLAPAKDGDNQGIALLARTERGPSVMSPPFAVA